MNGRPKRGSTARRRAATAAVCSVLVAVGGVLVAAPANADVIDAGSCTTPSTLVDTTGTGSGLIGLTGSTAGVTVGIDCVTAVTLGQAQPTASAPAQPVSRARTVPSSPATTESSTDETVGAAEATAITDAVADPAPATASTVAAASAASATHLSTLAVLRSSNRVYPVKDGFEDSVRFVVRAMNASGTMIPVVGSAVLTKAGATVATWHIDSSSTVITWNGRVHDAIHAGLYTLTVSAWSPDGSKQTEQARVRVLTKRLHKHAMTVRTNVGAKSVSADMPRDLLKAYNNGDITCRVVTVAKVHGPAKLVFSNNGVVRSVTLRNGSHTTKALPVPQGFSHVTITHAWKKGDAHLKSLKAIWTYYTLS